MTKATELKPCDLVMKGGLTSGVVYPSAIVEMSKTYRLHKIGGASAGAIAAVAAAAAEYRRQESEGGADDSGFTELGVIPSKLGSKLKTLFQPTPKLKPLFDTLLFMINKKEAGGKPFLFLMRAFFAYWKVTVTLFILIAALTACLSMKGQTGFAYLTAFAGFIAILTVIGYFLMKNFTKDIPANDFGICSGLTEPGSKDPALMDWLSDNVDLIAFGADHAARENRAPLLISDLSKHDIEIGAMTTDISSARPYQLPFKTRIHYFSKAEFSKIFPQYIMEYLLAGLTPADPHNDKGIPKDLYPLKIGGDMPVSLIARMSLSFPVLFTAVPLYRKDYGLPGQPYVRCLFSDGGISSNFPVHLFDDLLPSRPVFGISLGVYDDIRHQKMGKVHLPRKAPQSLPSVSIGGLAAFLGSIVNTAKDWQDTLQSRLPSYAERIVTIRLNPDKEGGMNLTMGTEQIKALEALGKEAGEKLAAGANLSEDVLSDGITENERRYRRALVAIPLIGKAVMSFTTAYNSPPRGDHNWDAIVKSYDPESGYPIQKTWRKDIFHKFAKDIVKLGQAALDFEKKGQSICDKDQLPSLDADFRISASADRVPES